MATADLEKIVKIIFSGDDTNLDKTIDSVNTGLKKVGSTITSATQPFADFTKQILAVDAVLSALAVGALVLATKEAGEFGSSFAEISTLIDEPKDKLQSFKTDILNYADVSTQSIEDINQSIYNAISAGEDYKTSLDLLRQAELLGVATKADLNTAIEILRPTLNAFGKSTKDAGDFADILFTAVKTGKTTLTELEPVLANVTGIASASGVSFDQVAAALAALTAAGLPTNLAVTQLKGALTGIFAPAKEAAKVAKDLEIEFGENALAGKTLNEVFALMVEKTGGTLEGMKALIPRVEGASAALILGRDAGGKYADALDEMANRAGNAAVAYDKMSDEFDRVNQKLVNNIRTTLIKIGIPLLDDWRDVALSIGEVFKGVKVGFDAGAFDGILGIVETLAQDLSNEFEGIAKALPEALQNIDFKDFEQALKDLVDTGKTLLNNLFGGLDLTKPEDLEKAIQKLVDTFENWVNLTEGIVKGLSPFLTAIANLASNFADLDADTAKLIGQFLGWVTAIDTAAAAIVVVTAPLALLAGTFKLLSLTHLPGLITGLGTQLPAALTTLTNTLKATTLGVAAFAGGFGIGTLLYENVPGVKAMGDSLGEMAYNLINAGDKAIVAAEKQAAHTLAMGKAAVAIVQAKEGIVDINKIKDPEVKIDLLLDKFYDDIDAFSEILDQIQKTPTTVDITADLKDEKFQSDWNVIKTIADDGTVTEIRVDSSGAVAETKKTKETIDKELQDKILLVKLQGEIDVEIEKIKTQAAVLQTAFEWNAKVKIANVEAAAKELEAIAGAVEVAWQSTGDVISSALGVLSSTDLSAARWKDVLDIIEREQDIREDLAQQLILLQQAQVNLLNQRVEALKKGQGSITINTEGLDPILDELLNSIVAKAQIKANEEGFASLLGI